jgi:hypothetical protein
MGVFFIERGHVCKAVPNGLAVGNAPIQNDYSSPEYIDGAADHDHHQQHHANMIAAMFAAMIAMPMIRSR